MIDKICDLDLCTGCSVCSNICPVQAITMKEGEIGHIFPKISDRCLECGKCIKTCPVNNPVQLLHPRKSYAAWSNNLQEHSSSTSGGIAAELSNWIIKNGGVVYGCAVLPQGKIEHIRCESQDQLSSLKGSKYVHSHIHMVVKSLISDLKDGRQVLFIGTPCQVAGVKNAVGKKDNNLFLVDLICHGVPSQQILFQHLESKGIKKANIDKIQFREKGGNYLSVVSKNHIVYRKNEREDLYYMGFNENLIFRESCFTCRYSACDRVGDLTIGDFWGLGAEQPFTARVDGNVSVILVNNEKGQSILNNCNETISLVERTLGEAVLGNHNLRQPSSCKKAKKFRFVYNGNNVESALKVCLRKRRFKCLVQRVFIKLGLLK